MDELQAGDIPKCLPDEESRQWATRVVRELGVVFTPFASSSGGGCDVKVGRRLIAFKEKEYTLIKKQMPINLTTARTIYSCGKAKSARFVREISEEIPLLCTFPSL